MNEQNKKYLDKMIVGSIQYFLMSRYQTMKSTADAIMLAKSDIIGLTNYMRGIGAIKGATSTIEGNQVLKLYIDADDFTPMLWSCSYEQTGAGHLYPEIQRIA